MSTNEDKLAVPVNEIPITTNTLAMLATTPAIPERYEGKVADMLAAVLYGREIGIPPMQAINDLYLVDGKVSMSGKLMSDLVHGRGHELRISFTPKSTIVAAWRRDPYTKELHHAGDFTFTEADAKKAGLTENAWKTYPQIMRTWRAITFACRTVFGDCLGGVTHTPEELGMNTDYEVEIIPESIAAIEGVDDTGMDMEVATANVTAVMEVVEVTDIAKK